MAPRRPRPFTRREILSAGGSSLLALAGCMGSSRAGRTPYATQTSIERVAEGDPTLLPRLVVDAQTHIWWRDEGVPEMTDRGRIFLEEQAIVRAWTLKEKPLHPADMNRMLFFEDVFLNSDTDIAFLNSFGMKGCFDGVDLFAPDEAAKIRDMAPERIKVLGTVDPPDGQSAVESLIYQCEALGIDGLKLYPPGPDARGWTMDDEEHTYPLYEVLRKYGVKTICVHKGFPGCFLEEHCHTHDLVRAAKDFPDLNFVAFHSAFPFDAELAALVKESGVKNVYAELGLLAPAMVRKPERFAEMLATLIDALGEDHILWGSDTPTVGGPNWQIQAFLAFDPPPESPLHLDDALKHKILGENAVRLFDIDVEAARSAVDDGLLGRVRKHVDESDRIARLREGPPHPGACKYDD